MIASQTYVLQHILRSYHSEKIGRPVDSADLKVGKGHVEGDKEEVGDAQDQDEDILRCQHHLNSMIELFKQNIMQFFVLWAKLLGMPLQRRLLWVIGDSPPTTQQSIGSGTSLISFVLHENFSNISISRFSIQVFYGCVRLSICILPAPD